MISMLKVIVGLGSYLRRESKIYNFVQKRAPDKIELDHTIIDATSDRNIERRKERQFWIAKSKLYKMIYFFAPKVPFSPYRMSFY
jgi:hypothetical protein